MSRPQDEIHAVIDEIAQCDVVMRKARARKKNLLRIVKHWNAYQSTVQRVMNPKPAKDNRTVY